MDLLSDVFALLKVQARLSARFEAGGEWAAHFPAQPHLKFGVALHGNYWLTVDGSEPRLIEAGDTYLLANSPGYTLSSDPALPAIDGRALYAQVNGNHVRLGGDGVVVLGGSFFFDERNAGLLLDLLPALIVIPSSNPAASSVRSTLQLLEDELQTQQIGAAVISSRLGDILLVQALRALAASGIPTGWLGALGDRKIGEALRLMHADVAHDWKVGELATTIGMSRSDFARKFKERVGLPPLDYLIRWRMYLARQALQQKGVSAAMVAESVGYSSASAFGNAFKRMFGHSPKRDDRGN